MPEVTARPREGMGQLAVAELQGELLQQQLQEQQTSGAAKIVQDVYEGDTDDRGRPHGRGRMVYGSGETYDGQWRRGQRHGRGAYSNPDGFQYRGQWAEGRAEGIGWARLAAGGEYEGEWRGGKRHGWGLLRGAGGEVYEGQWADDVIHGLGHFTLADGSYFEGRYEHGVRVEGTTASADGQTTYTGGFKGRLRHGRGLLVVAGRFRYRGAWAEGRRCGRGACQYADGSTYRGEWREDAWHGVGEWRERGGAAAAVVATSGAGWDGDDEDGGAWAGEAGEGGGGGGGVAAGIHTLGVLRGGGDEAGAWYRGEFVKGARQGKGTARDAQGNLYVGDWYDNARHGSGSCSYACGDKYVGQWERGVRHGKGACVYANGDKYEGEWRHDVRHGYGVAVFADGVKFGGRWEEDCWVQSGAEPALCRVAGPGVSRAVAGQTARLVIEARDDLGNRRLSGGESFRVELRRPAATSPMLAGLGAGTAATNGDAAAAAAAPGAAWASMEMEDEAGAGKEVLAVADVYDRDDGTYGVSYSCCTAGFLELHVLLEDPDGGAARPVADSPYIVRVAGGKPTPRTTTVVGVGRRVATAGGRTSFVVEPRDAWGNRVDVRHLPGGLPLQVSLSNGVLDVPLSVQLSDAGRPEYVVSYEAPAVPGLYRLQVVDGSSGRHVGDSPFSVQVLAVSQGEAAELGKPPAEEPVVTPSNATAAAAASTPAALSDGGGPSSRPSPPLQGPGLSLPGSDQAAVDLVGEWGRRAEVALRELEAAGKAVDAAGERMAQKAPAGGAAAGREEEKGYDEGSSREVEAEAELKNSVDGGGGGGGTLPEPVVAEGLETTAAAAAAAAAAATAAEAGISESELQYIMAHESVPVVEDMRDLWKIHQMQEERKARELLARLAA